MFVEEVEKYHNGTWKGTAFWPRMKDGAGIIAPINEKLMPADAISLVDQTRVKLINVEIAVFKGL